MAYQSIPVTDTPPPPTPPKHFLARKKPPVLPGTISDPSHTGPRPRIPSRHRYGPSASKLSGFLPGPGGPTRTQTQADHKVGSGTAGTADPAGWAAMTGGPEDDDFIHNPDPKRDQQGTGTIFTSRGIMNIGCLVILVLCLLGLFAGYPIASFYSEQASSTNGAYNLGGVNASGQIPSLDGFASLIDSDTPSDAYTRTGFDGEEYTLVFSDEFEQDGRTFWPGDDPFWTAVDIHYWPTGDFEWYDPSAITTNDGHLTITMTQEPIHDLNFKSGMLQSWNQMCFQYSAYIEVSVSLPGNNKIGGFWPGVWAMGNLGRPGYGATTDGTWPYTYDSCDIGTLANQTTADGSGPEGALTSGSDDGVISYLPGQRLSACTCTGEDHPGPDVSYGRGVPEIDIIEGQIDVSLPQGQVSQSCQIAPFDESYQYLNTSDATVQYDTDKTSFNTYKGGTYQEAVSSLTYIDNANYVGTDNQFAIFGFEYFSDPNDRDSGYITWVADGEKTWTMYPASVGPSDSMEIGQRLISEEPMALVFNFAMSNNFQTVDFANLDWPAEMQIDYVRVYQRSEGKLGCDPDDRPTASYISDHAEAYNNPNYTTWEEAGFTFPASFFGAW